MILTVDIGGTLIKTLEWPSEKVRFAINFDEINFEKKNMNKSFLLVVEVNKLFENISLKKLFGQQMNYMTWVEEEPT
ncbi:MAG: hypothetical protein CMG75_04220 [Candidatus Marinimicrobia bacterium]|nr:hypothetical protein [Candidatus Neomarinimicrobiota bacterium]|tara:strand:+ start:237 stop:467 length:231 start_codon:yes stop_codon:yes gene_type:complete